ncbi:MAG TPA: hypothetical protein VFD49_10235 [Candidatus Dormibacteraeota bacterium]|nr:hypothetical protein [Candidatus Dormibacteraeota bacterium]
MRLGNHEPLALALVEAIRAGDLASPRGLLARHPGLAAARIEDARGADPSWVPPYNRSTCLEIAGALDTHRQTLITWLRERTGQPAGDRP